VLGMGVGPPGSRSASVTALVTLAPVSLQAPLVFALTPLADGEPVVDDVAGHGGEVSFADLAPGRYQLVMSTREVDLDSAGIGCSPTEVVESVDAASHSMVLDLTGGQEVSCTFAAAQRGEIIVAHATQPRRGNVDATVAPSWGASFPLPSGGIQTSDPLAAGTYSVTASTPPGWDTSSGTCDDGSAADRIVLDPGETVTCTFTSVQRGAIALVTQTKPRGAQQPLTVRPSWSEPVRLAGADTTTWRRVAPGTYSLSVPKPKGWDVTTARCDGRPGLGTIDVAPGETVRCTVTLRQRGRVVVVAETDPADSQQSFTVKPSWGPAFRLGDGASATSRLLAPGTYTVDETSPPGWVRSAADCDDGSSIDAIDVGPGETVTCTLRYGQPTFTVASFNVLGHSHTEPGGHSAPMASGPTRMAWTVDLLRSWGVDVVGLQEFQNPQMDAFLRLAGGEYSVYPGPELDQGNKQNAIAWRSSVFDLVEGRPVMTPYFGGNLVPMPLVRLRHKATGLDVYVMSVHNAASTRRTGDQTRWRDAAMRQQIALTDQLVRQGVPVIMTGDMNEREKYFCAYTASGQMRAAAGGSNAGSCQPPPASIARIDWIFGSTDVSFSDYRFVKDGSVTRASDHPLVLAEAALGG
jgi:endonuclease/exonuclease/phosphatase family metal-dependent hydrolase